MFKKLRRNDRELSLTCSEDILKNCEYGILSTISQNGYPYGVPVNYVYLNGKIYFHCAPGVGHKIENIEHCSNVCFTVVCDTQVMPEKFSTKYKSAIAFGTVKSVDTNKYDALYALIEKYCSGFKDSGRKYLLDNIENTGVYEITIDHLTGKARK